MLMDITNSLLAFDKDLSKLSSLEFQKELKKYSRMKKDWGLYDKSNYLSK